MALNCGEFPNTCRHLGIHETVAPWFSRSGHLPLGPADSAAAILTPRPGGLNMADPSLSNFKLVRTGLDRQKSLKIELGLRKDIVMHLEISMFSCSGYSTQSYGAMPCGGSRACLGVYLGQDPLLTF